MSSEIYDVIIIGSGPAGYCCGLYSSRANRNVLLFEGSMDDGLYPGGQLTITSDIENYLGFPEGINGFELTEKFKQQAERFGVKTIQKTITKIDISSFPYSVEVNRRSCGSFPKGTSDLNRDSVEVEDLNRDSVYERENVYQTRSIVIASGATAKRLGIPQEERFWHHGISACAVCDGALPMFRNKPLVVVGGGDTAMEEASFLSKYGSKVYLIHRRDSFRASKIMVDRVMNNPKIEVIWNSVVVDGEGEKKLERLLIRNVVSGEEKWLDVNGLFYAIGHTPNTSFLENHVELDEDKYVITKPGTTHTNIPGVFACGDVQDKKYRQAITAAGSGCMASIDVEHWLNSL
jgi:thioredoxin reductase (NADPH)